MIPEPMIMTPKHMDYLHRRNFRGVPGVRFLEWGVPYPYFSGAWQKNNSDMSLKIHYNSFNRL